MHPANQRLRKPDKLSQGVDNQTSYPRVQWGNTLNKRGGYRTLDTEGQRATVTGELGNVRSRNNQEHITTHAAGS